MKNKGITLIALVITIIVLLIIAGVSIATLTSENGILNQTIKAKETTELETEKEGLRLTITAKNTTNDIKYDIGKKLFDKTIENGNKWNVIVMNRKKLWK